MKMSFVFSHPSHKMTTARQLSFTVQKGNTQAPKLWVREDNSAVFWDKPGSTNSNQKKKNNSTWHKKNNQRRLLSGAMWRAGDGGKADPGLSENVVTQPSQDLHRCFLGLNNPLPFYGKGFEMLGTFQEHHHLLSAENWQDLDLSVACVPWAQVQAEDDALATHELKEG